MEFDVMTVCYGMMPVPYTCLPTAAKLEATCRRYVPRSLGPTGPVAFFVIWAMAGPMSLLGLFAFAATAHATSPTPVEKIDAAIAEHWEAYGLSPAPEEQDGKWCRRVFLDLIGRIPTFDELQDFLRDRDADKREKLVNRLLEDSQYTEEYAGHWASIWSNILIGRSGGQDRRSLISREGMDKYLRDCFADNKTYDRMVYELITATGTTKPGSEGFNGATNFLIDKVNAGNFCNCEVVSWVASSMYPMSQPSI